MNSIGWIYRLTTFGESHGPAIGGVIDGCPTGLAIDYDLVADELRRRREGDVPGAAITKRQEMDSVEWLSGLFEGRTTGTPIAFMVRNEDCRPEDYELLRGCCRPGHADYTYSEKYGWRDHRGGGRASGRETVARVVAGAVAKQLLAERDVRVESTLEGRVVRCTVTGLPAGVGEPIYDKLNARLAYAMMSIPSAMSFTIGESMDSWRMNRDDYPDQWKAGGSGDTLTETNHCGGIQGGISNGMPVVMHVGFHPPTTNTEGMDCRQEDGELRRVAPHGRHDTDHASRLPVIVESMAAMTVLDMMMLMGQGR